MAEVLYDIRLIIGSIAIVGTIIGCIRYLIKRGRKEQSHENKIENLSEYIEELEANLNSWRDEVREDIDNEIRKASEQHTKLFDKLEKLGKDLKYLKGQFDQSNR